MSERPPAPVTSLSPSDRHPTRPSRPRLRPAGRRPDGPVWNWRVAARCRTENSEELFVTGASQREAREFCVVCPVRTECLAHALDQQIEFGVWGGMTERERRAVLRRRPDVRSWSRLLGRARTEHYAGSWSSGARGA
jgi:WhiB family transcriptional regulator, redox-sensing transcriptional regulator